MALWNQDRLVVSRGSRLLGGLLLSAGLAGCGSVVPTGGDTEDATGAGSSTGADEATAATTLPSGPSTSGPSTSAGPTGPDDTSTSSTTAPSGTSPATTRATFTTADDSSGTDETDTSIETTVAFIGNPDGGVCLGNGTPDGYAAHCSQCSPWDQDCGEGDRCVPWANDGGEFWNSTRCSEIDPSPDLVGQACTVEGAAASGLDSCDIGLLCFNVDPETLTGTCATFCQGNEANPLCDDPDTQCVIANYGELPLCLESCDPLLQDCVDGLACYGVGAPGESAPTVCLRPQIGVSADGIAPAFCPLGSNGVDPLLIATCAEDEPCCAAWCDLSAADSCAEGLTCAEWADGNQPGQDDRGVCVDP